MGDAIRILINTAADIGYNCTLDNIGYNEKYNNYYIWTEDYMFSIFVNDLDQIPTAYYSCPNCGDEFFCDIERTDTIVNIETKLQNQIDEYKKSKKECRVN